MSKITRDEVKNNFDTVKTEIEKIEEILSKPVIYNTATKYLTGIGYIAEIDSVKGIVKANKAINAMAENFDESAKELGVELEEEENTILGYPVDMWKEDLKKRLEMIQHEQKLVKLTKARKVLKKNLSEDDIFDMEMESVADLLK